MGLVCLTQGGLSAENKGDSSYKQDQSSQSRLHESLSLKKGGGIAVLNDIDAIKVMVEGFLLTLCAKFLSIQITS